MSRSTFMIIGSAFFALVLGVVWYAEPVAGGLRMDALGIPRVGPVVPSATFLALKFGLAIAAASLLWRLIRRLGVDTAADGARTGATIGLVCGALAFDAAQAGQPLELIATDTVFFIAVLALLGGLLAAARP